jgi:membrane protease YdiL (CAAX protease family)
VLTVLIAAGVWLHLTRSRLDAIDDPPRALALIVERMLDLDDALRRAAPWERRFYELTVTDGRNDLDEAITWYEEVADAVPGSPDVQAHLAVLYGEAGRTHDVIEEVERLRARADVARADVLAAAYLDAPIDSIERVRETAAAMVPSGWFRDRLLLRLADRAGDAAGRVAVVAAADARSAPLLRRLRGLTAVELTALGAGVWGLVVVLRRREIRVDAAPVPPPWRFRDGLVVLVRGAAAGAVVLLALSEVGRWIGPSDVLVSSLGLPLMYVPTLLLARWRLLAPAGSGLLRGFGYVPARGGGRAFVCVVALLLGAGAVTDLALGLLSAAAGTPAHWTEWFDEDLAWGNPTLVVTSLLGTVVFAPVLEELVFRGLLYGTLRRRLAWPVAAVLSAGVFALAHGYGAAGFGSVFVSGLLWSVAYEKTGSLWPSTAAHVLNNVAAALTVLLLLRA